MEATIMGYMARNPGNFTVIKTLPTTRLIFVDFDSHYSIPNVKILLTQLVKETAEELIRGGKRQEISTSMNTPSLQKPRKALLHEQIMGSSLSQKL